MTLAWLALAVLSALALYLASDQQQLRVAPLANRRLARAAGWVVLAASVVVAWIALGPLPGVFAALCAWMLALIVLPLLGTARESSR